MWFLEMWFLSEPPVVTAHIYPHFHGCPQHQIIIRLSSHVSWSSSCVSSSFMRYSPYVSPFFNPWHTWYILVLPLQDTNIAVTIVTTLREVIHSSSAIIWALSASKISWLWTATLFGGNTLGIWWWAIHVIHWHQSLLMVREKFTPSKTF